MLEVMEARSLKQEVVAGGLAETRCGRAAEVLIELLRTAILWAVVENAGALDLSESVARPHQLSLVISLKRDGSMS